MQTHRRPSRYGYSYRKQARPQQAKQARRGDSSSRLQFRLFGMQWRALPLYRQAGCPFGESDIGLLLWLEFGRRSYSN